MSRHRLVLYPLLGAILVPAFDRLALSGTGSEDQLWRYLAPLTVGLLAGALVSWTSHQYARRAAALRQAQGELEDALTEARQSALALAEAEERSRAILDSTPAGVVVVDRETRRIVQANHVASDLLEIAERELVGLTCDPYLCPHDGPCPDLSEQTEPFEGVLTTARGHRVPVLKSVARISLDGRPHLVETMVDLRRQKETQERLAAAERLESLGVLAGGVAHDLNNVLGPVLALPDLIHADVERLLNEGGDPAEVYEDLDLIRASALRAARTIKDLTVLARRASIKRSIVDLRRQLPGWLSGLTPLLSRREVGLVTDPGDLPVHVDGSAAHLERVVMNLVRNSAEASAPGGQVRVSLTIEHVATERPVIHGDLPTGVWACLTVEDDGHGISPDDLDRIFEPFFTRKQYLEHSGSGLGLAIVHGVVKDHDGHLEVRSAPGEGSTFTVYLPYVDAVIPAAGEVAPAPVARGGPKLERVLVVEDTPSQQALAQRILTHAGYAVATATGAEAAGLALGSGFDLAVVDLPTTALAERLQLVALLRTDHPALAVVLTSGSAPSAEVKQALDVGVVWLPKPYLPGEMTRAAALALTRTTEPLIEVLEAGSEEGYVTGS